METPRLTRHERLLRRSGLVDASSCESRSPALESRSSSRSTTPKPEPKVLSNRPEKVKKEEDQKDKQEVEPQVVEEDRESTKENVARERPAALVDGLSRFFTPSCKRRSRVASNSIGRSLTPTKGLSKAGGRSKSQQQQGHGSKSQRAANQLVRKSRLLQANKARKTGRKNKNSAMKGLFDGLSHLFSAEGERRKTGTPQYHFPLKSPSKSRESRSPVKNSGGEAAGAPPEKFDCEFELFEYSVVVKVHVSRGRGAAKGLKLKMKKSKNQEKSHSCRGFYKDPTLSPGPKKGRGRPSVDNEEEGWFFFFPLICEIELCYILIVM